MADINFQKNGIPIKLELSESAPDSVLSINKDGHRLILVWDNEKTSADVIITNEISNYICEYTKFLINQIHEHEIDVKGYFHAGQCYTIIRSPYIYKLILIETNDTFNKRYTVKDSSDLSANTKTLYKKIKYPIVVQSHKKILTKTIVIKKVIIVNKNDNIPDCANVIADTLYNKNYTCHIEILKKYINPDLVTLISTYLTMFNIFE